ncbi:MAG: two pore domain potassium channel family protein [Candidatus Dormibacteraeota bacterium]|nr:two pore domain potassium channel family protein [Candidatus Dormibacteraeota bacterium]
MARRHLTGLTFERTVELLAVTGAFATIPLTVIEWDHESLLTDGLDSLIWAIFVVETFVLWRRARRGGGGWFWVGVSAFVCVVSCPAWLVIFRQFEDLAGLTRLLRVARLVRLGGVGFIGFPALRRIVRPGLIYVAGLTGLLIVIAAGIFTLVEPGVHHDYMSGLWLATVTAATVGYGDVAPKTPLGRVTAVALMIAGVGLLSTLSASIAAAFIGQEDAQEERETRRRIAHIESVLRDSLHGAELKERIERMEALLEAVARQNGVDAGPDAAPAGAQEKGSTS